MVTLRRQRDNVSWAVVFPGRCIECGTVKWTAAERLFRHEVKILTGLIPKSVPSRKSAVMCVESRCFNG